MLADYLERASRFAERQEDPDIRRAIWDACRLRPKDTQRFAECCEAVRQHLGIEVDDSPWAERGLTYYAEYASQPEVVAALRGAADACR